MDALTQLSSDVLSPTTATAEEAKKLIYARNQIVTINPLFETSRFTAGGLGLGILIWLILVITLCQRQKFLRTRIMQQVWKSLLILTNLRREHKSALLILIDVILLTSTFFAANALRLDRWSDFPSLFDKNLFVIFLASASTFLVIAQFTGVYKTLVRFFVLNSLTSLLASVFCSSVIAALLIAASDEGIPRSVSIVYFTLGFLSLSSARLGMKTIVDVVVNEQESTRVAIYGAGRAGRQLAKALLEGNTYKPVIFIDDNNHLDGVSISGIKVSSLSKAKATGIFDVIKSVFIAIPSATKDQHQRLIDKLAQYCLDVRITPSLSEFLASKIDEQSLRRINIEDLLGRDLIEPMPKLMNANIRDKFILITGAGGSIGSELCRQIVPYKPKAIFLLDNSEYALFQIEKELKKLILQHEISTTIHPLLCSATDKEQLNQIFRKNEINTIFHAAAFKHVPLVEINPISAILNNIVSTKNLCELATKYAVENLALISSDKAVRPTNLMGVSKRVSELICRNSSLKNKATNYTTVRFGNVLGSSGSVVPLFEEMIESGGPIEVTHPEISRYFMTIKEAAQLVIQASAMRQGNGVFFLDMGEQIKILDLATKMAQIRGLKPIFENEKSTSSQDTIEITFTGLRPGEKLLRNLIFPVM